VTITVEHGGEPEQMELTRSAVSVPVVASTLREVCGKKVGIVALSQFSSGAHGEVYAALKKLQKRGAQAFVLDLRGNGGGLVDEAQLIASAFLRDGAIVTTRGRSVPSRTLKATGDPLVPKAPLVVMVDRATASASEIVAGALQDRDRATLVGARTFGKGVFQEVLELSNGGALDITAGQYFTPDGRNLGGRGVQTGAGLRPDISASDDAKTARDEQLAAGLDALARKAGCKRPTT
jgi:carboxyl-terminal processing protease